MSPRAPFNCPYCGGPIWADQPHTHHSSKAWPVAAPKERPVPICACVKRHAPPLVVTDKHHIQPQSWGGQTVPENLVELCPSTHYTTHALLNEYVRANGTPPPAVLKRYPAYARALAAQAVAAVTANGGTIPHIYTLSVSGGHTHAHR